MDKKFCLFVLLIFLFSFIVISCDYFVFKNYKEWLKSTGNLEDVDVYTCGWVSGPSGCYWINNNDPILLDDCLVGTSLCIDNNDVYVAGYDNSSQASYWKNGEKHLLPASGSSRSCDLVVKGGVVFNSGVNNSTELCYWVNDVRYQLDTAGLTAGSVYFVGINVDNIGSSKYEINLAGSFDSGGGNNTAILWKNGGSDVYILTPTADAYVKTNRLVKYENDLYIAGNGGSGSGPGYWKNTTFIPLPDYVDDQDYLIGICVKNNKIYGVGTDNGSVNALFWEDNNVSPLPVGGTPSLAIGIFIYNDDIYIAGESGNQACYWVNGNRVDLPGTTQSTAADILVVPSRD